MVSPKIVVHQNYENRVGLKNLLAARLPHERFRLLSSHFAKSVRQTPTIRVFSIPLDHCKTGDLAEFPFTPLVK